MSRYIDADALVEQLKDERDFYKKMYDCMQQPCEQDERAIIGVCYTAYSKCCHMVKHAPTVDAVPVVRCGECKHFVENTWECSRLCDRFGDEYSDARVYPDWFCADGERKDGERDV